MGAMESLAKQAGLRNTEMVNGGILEDSVCLKEKFRRLVMGMK